MITIRYADLPEGLHARAEAQGRRTVIYLRPGLTAEQRRLSLRRARQSARMGYGPRLSGPGVALAVARHVSGGTLRNLAAAIRRHPVGFLLVSVAFAALMTWYALVVTVSVRLMLDPAPAPAAVPPPLPARVLLPATGHRGRAAVLSPGTARRGPAHRDLVDRDARTARRAGPSATATAPGPPAGPTPTARPSPSATTPSPSPTGCVTVGPFGVCA
jgi:hypothetical protein